MTETIEVRRKRLIHRSRYTGMKETDLVLGRFAERYVPGFDARQLDRYERLLAEPDPAIFAWISGQEPVPAAHQSDVMTLLKNFKLSI
jgi:antitoxin CptB